MHFEGKLKMGYYPTPVIMMKHIKSFMNYQGKHVSILDPCVGCGTAVKSLVEQSEGFTYGVEIDEIRFKKAKAVCHKVLPGGIESASITNKFFSALFLNPPYDNTMAGETTRSERKEKTFLIRTFDYLKPGGVLIYVIPQYSLISDIARMLTYRLEDIRVFRFSDEEYSAYSQIIVMGVRKTKFFAEIERANNLVAKAELGDMLEQIPMLDKPVYLVPGSSKEIPTFRSNIIDEEALLSQIKKDGLMDRIKRKTERVTQSNHCNPPTNLHQGHIGLLLASAYLNGKVDESNGKGHLTKGRTFKSTVETEVRENGRTVKSEREMIKVKINALTPEGEFITML